MFCLECHEWQENSEKVKTELEWIETEDLENLIHLFRTIFEDLEMKVKALKNVQEG